MNHHAQLVFAVACFFLHAFACGKVGTESPDLYGGKSDSEASVEEKSDEGDVAPATEMPLVKPETVSADAASDPGISDLLDALVEPDDLPEDEIAQIEIVAEEDASAQDAPDEIAVPCNNACDIEGKCFLNKDKNPLNPCEICDFAFSHTQWTWIAGCCTSSDVCGDQNLCTADACIENICVHSPLVCDDQNSCTDNACEGGQGCVYAPNDKACDDEDPHTLVDACTEGVCVGTMWVACFSDADCPDDGNFCNGYPHCTADGACVIDPETVVTCPEAGQCTHIKCDAQTGECLIGNIEDGESCNDDSVCTKDDACKDGACAGTPVICDDANSCTDDSCDAAKGCMHIVNITPCDDGNACTTLDACFGGLCMGQPVVCGDENFCTDDSCDPSNGCVFAFNSLPCNDNDACTADERCVDGQCLNGTVVTCADSNPCTDDACNPNMGCIYANNNAPCNDNDACTTGDVCANAMCAGVLVVCDDGDPCTSGEYCDNGKCIVGSSCEIGAGGGPDVTGTDTPTPGGEADPCDESILPSEPVFLENVPWLPQVPVAQPGSGEGCWICPGQDPGFPKGYPADCWKPCSGACQTTLYCGPTVVAMIESWAKGVTPTKATLYELGLWAHNNFVDSQGNSTWALNCGSGDGTEDFELKAMLLSHGKFPEVTVTKKATVCTIAQALMAGHPVIVHTLTQVKVNNTKDGPEDMNLVGASHWMLVVGISKTSIWVNDPGRSQSHKDSAEYREFTLASFKEVWEKGKTYKGYVFGPDDRIVIEVHTESNCPDSADCTGKACGIDPVCGVSCGTCPDQFVCTSQGQCLSTECPKCYTFSEAEGKCVHKECPDDGNPCTVDFCGEFGVCQHEKKPVGTSCGNGYECSSGGECVPSAWCGNGKCDAGESVCNCPNDNCLVKCGDNCCTAGQETCSSCQSDCGQCQQNACGGNSTLFAQPGASCGVCGIYQCSGTDAVTCADPGQNACGGCTPLSLFGASCGTNGTYICNGANSLICKEAPPQVVCSDGICTKESETEFSCPSDCGCAAAGSCGNDSPSGCWCDAVCYGAGDCCPDACSACGMGQCTKGSVETAQCGLCQGSQSRSCTNSCTWSSWSACGNAPAFDFDPNKQCGNLACIQILSCTADTCIVRVSKTSGNFSSSPVDWILKDTTQGKILALDGAICKNAYPDAEWFEISFNPTSKGIVESYIQLSLLGGPSCDDLYKSGLSLIKKCF